MKSECVACGRYIEMTPERYDLHGNFCLGCCNKAGGAMRRKFDKNYRYRSTTKGAWG